MDNNFDNLKKLIDRLKTIGFLERLFSWRKVRELLIDAVSDLQKITGNADNLVEKNTEYKTTNSGLVKDLDLAKATIITQKAEIENQKAAIQEQIGQLSGLNSSIASKETTIESQKNRVNQLEISTGLQAQQNEQLNKDYTAISQEIATVKENLRKTTERKNQLEIDNEGLRINNGNLQNERDALRQQNTQLLTEEEGRKVKYESDVATLTSIRDQIQGERNAEVEAKNNAEIERMIKLKQTWNNHQGNVKSIIKNISNKHIIEYVEIFPLKGDPDNTLKICDEFVIFDAKSPGAEDLTNFPIYLKDQAEKAKKYAKQEGVKKDIFFVVPTNTLEKLTQFVFNLGDYDVFIISIDSVEQIILSLKKIESYEFAEMLSPEERDNICRVLGKFAHLTKRRIQIDSFFAKQFIELAYKSEADLPKEFLNKVIEFEKSEKLNPPVERRAKAISTKELEKDTATLKTEAAAKGIFIDDNKLSDGINLLQLYHKETEE
jgi:hypothetical protein